MQVTLKKAEHLQRIIADTMSNLYTNNSKEVIQPVNNEVDIEKVEKDSIARFELAQKTITTLAEIRRDIRKVVSKANQESGVSDLLCEVNFYASEIERINQILVLTMPTTPGLASSYELMLERYQNAESSFCENIIRVGVLTPKFKETLEKTVHRYTKQKNALLEKITEKNFQTKIEISDIAWTTLETLELV